MNRDLGRAARVLGAGLLRLVWGSFRGLIVVGGVAVALYGGLELWKQLAPRKVKLCAVTDFGFRQSRPGWQMRLNAWFRDVNSVFADAGVTWDVTEGGDAFPGELQPRAAFRQAALDSNPGCRADVIVAFTGEPPTDEIASPFSHSVLLSVGPRESDAAVVTRISRVLAKLFGTGTKTTALTTTDGARNSVLDPPSLKLISTMRRFDFAKGVAALPGKWEGRATAALTQAFEGKAPNPALEAHRIVGRAFAHARMHAEAARELQEAVRFAPSDSTARVELAVELSANAKHDEALQQLRTAARLDPEDARPYGAMAAIFLNTRRIEDAIEALRIATTLDAGQSSYQLLLGEILTYELGGTQEAGGALKAALRSDPHSEDALQGLADVEKLPEILTPAVHKLESAIRQTPQSASLHLRLGVALAKEGNVEAARKELTRATELAPRSGVSHYALARLLYVSGDYAGAQAQAIAAKNVGDIDVPAAFLDLLARKTKAGATSRTF